MKPTQQTTSTTAGSHRSDFVHQRVHHFGLTLVVMGISFGLYYLGLFGGVEGPLAPERIGSGLADLGFSGRHLLYFFLLLTAVAATWNWMYNAACRILKRNSGKTVKKGIAGHFAWIMLLVFSIIVYCQLP